MNNRLLGRVHCPVQFSEGKIEQAHDAINLFFEYAIFFRWMYFKNRPRANLLFIRAFLITSTFFFIYVQFRHDFELILEGFDMDPVLAYIAAIVIGDWKMVNTFYRKSEACEALYIEMIKAEGAGNTHLATLLSNALAIELITMDLWAHRKYSRIFANNLALAIDHVYSIPERPASLKLAESIDQVWDALNRGKMQVHDAREILNVYQLHLLATATRVAQAA